MTATRTREGAAPDHRVKHSRSWRLIDGAKCYRCTRCEKWKPIESFGPLKKPRCARRGACRRCRLIRDNASRKRRVRKILALASRLKTAPPVKLAKRRKTPVSRPAPDIFLAPTKSLASHKQDTKRPAMNDARYLPTPAQLAADARAIREAGYAALRAISSGRRAARDADEGVGT